LKDTNRKIHNLEPVSVTMTQQRGGGWEEEGGRKRGA